MIFGVARVEGSLDIRIFRINWNFIFHDLCFNSNTFMFPDFSPIVRLSAICYFQINIIYKKLFKQIDNQI